MVFSSHLFLFYFLPLALAGYYLLPRRGQHLFLTLVSYVFYGWANPLFVFLMLAQTAIDYTAGLVIAGCVPWRRQPAVRLPEHAPRTRRQKLALTLTVVSNLSLLAFFKYFNFVTANYDAAVRALGLPDWALNLALHVPLPLGISFYTFQSLSYGIDVYRGHAKVMRNFIDYACYVAMFPQLVAGPIIRFSEVADQLESRTHTAEKFARGVTFFAFGLAKKVLLANPCGQVADACFNAGSVGTADAWTGVLAYAFQIYFDFSGYSDMAIGLGLMTGFVFAKNFDSPYQSASITEFWRRWHLSLSTWLRDYLYLPLGGNRKGPIRTYFNLLATMLLGGLWHGASWNFLIWGGLHGGLLCGERALGKHPLYDRLPRPAKVALTFTLILFTWVFFRAADLPSALRYCGSMLGLSTPQDGAGLLAGLIYTPYLTGALLLSAAVVWLAPQTWDFTRRLTWPKAAYATLVLAQAIAILVTQSYNPFIYFIF